MSRPAPSQPAMGNREWMMLLLLSILWGASFLFIGLSVRSIPPFTVVLGRVGIASFVMLLVLYQQGQRLPWSLSAWGGFVGMSLLSNLFPFSLITWGQTQIPAGLTSIIIASTPLFTAVLAHFLTSDESLTLPKIGGVLLGLIGVTVLIGPELARGIGAQGLAQLAVLAAAFFYGASAIFGRRYRHIPPMVMTTGMLVSTTVIMTPVALWYDFPLVNQPSWLSIGALICLAVLATAVAYILYFRILATAGATNASLVTLLIPVSAVLLGVLFLGEQLTANILLGMGLIFAGLILTDGRFIKSQA